MLMLYSLLMLKILIDKLLRAVQLHVASVVGFMEGWSRRCVGDLDTKEILTLGLT